MNVILNLLFNWSEYFANVSETVSIRCYDLFGRDVVLNLLQRVKHLNQEPWMCNID